MRGKRTPTMNKGQSAPTEVRPVENTVVPTDERIMQDRLEKLEALRASGVNPYPNKFDTTATANELQVKYAHLENEESVEDIHQVAGRMMAKRGQGNVMFLDLQDRSDKIQVLVSKRDFTGDYKALQKLLDYGDWIGVTGTLNRTPRGELSIKATDVVLLAKCLRPLPPPEEKNAGFTDIEKRLDNRSVDLAVNEKTRETFIVRSQMTQGIRNYLYQNGYIECEVPLLQEEYGGAAATPFTTHAEKLDQDMYLSISPELYLKRLLIGGLDRVFTINRCFRNESTSFKHNPEFTTLEAYQLGADYNDMMDLTQTMIQEVCQAARGSLNVEFDGKQIDLSGDWKRITLADAIEGATGLDIYQSSADDIRSYLDGKKIDTSNDHSWAQLVDHAFSKFVEPNLIEPTFITDYPVELSPLAKQREDNPRVTERFELMIAGFELANSFSELNDPVEQAKRFAEQEAMRDGGDVTAQPSNARFIRDMEYGMPVCGGVGIGLDRLAMLLTNNQSIREVILFPARRRQS